MGQDAAANTCKHGSLIGRGFPQTGMSWLGGVATCSCCKSGFGYINSCSGTSGPGSLGITSSSTWTPADKCAACGGKQVRWHNPAIRKKKENK